MYTTRPPRMNEKDGVDYHFIDVDTYLSMREGDEWEIDQEFNGWYYGNSKKDFLTSDIILLTPSGIRELSQEIRDTSIIVYLDIPEPIRYTRLSERNDADDVRRRLMSDEEDFKDFLDYDVLLTDSDTINFIFSDMLRIIRK
jgi:guanylate kinase